MIIMILQSYIIIDYISYNLQNYCDNYCDNITFNYCYRYLLNILVDSLWIVD